MREYALGSKVRIYGTFTNVETGALTDPTTVKVSIRRPKGKIVTYTYGSDAEVIKDAIGEYYLDVDANVGGGWWYRWFSEGTGQAADEKGFLVKSAKAKL